jgi:hypothetical protein
VLRQAGPRRLPNGPLLFLGFTLFGGPAIVTLAPVPIWPIAVAPVPITVAPFSAVPATAGRVILGRFVRMPFARDRLDHGVEHRLGMLDDHVPQHQVAQFARASQVADALARHLKIGEVVEPLRCPLTA